MKMKGPRENYIVCVNGLAYDFHNNQDRARRFFKRKRAQLGGKVIFLKVQK